MIVHPSILITLLLLVAFVGASTDPGIRLAAHFIPTGDDIAKAAEYLKKPRRAMAYEIISTMEHVRSGLETGGIG